jgi:HEAT repeat protein
MRETLLPAPSRPLPRGLPAVCGLTVMLCTATFQPVLLAQSTVHQTPKRAPAAPAGQPAREQSETVAAAWKRITAATTSGKVRTRATALQTLASAGDRPEAVQMLQQAMKDQHADIRKAAAYSLGKMHARAAIPRLRQALDDTSPSVRVAAARALWEMKDYTGRDLLIRIVERRAPAEEAKLRQEWQQALHRVDSPSAVFMLALEQGIGFLPGPSFLAIPLVREATKDKSAPGRATAATLLADQAIEPAVEALELALVDPEPVVRAAAALSLGKIGRPEEIIQLAPLLHDHKPTVRLAAAVAIARLSPPGSGPMPPAVPQP